MARGAEFTFGGFLARTVAGVALTLATWNPSGWSWLGWALGRGEGDLPLVALTGVILLILYAVFLRATWAAMGAFGVILAGALVGALLWVLVDRGVLSLEGSAAAQWAGLVGVGLVLGIGLSWAHVRRLLSGQTSVDEIEG